MQTANNFTIETCTKENVTTIVDGINQYNLSKVPALSEEWTRLQFIAKNEKGTEVGGILAVISYWNGLYINILWINEDYRKKGIGTQLLKYTEKIAKEKGATISILDTFDFQAENFYLKNGYEPFGELKDYPKGHKRIYLSKKLV